MTLTPDLQDSRSALNTQCAFYQLRDHKFMFTALHKNLPNLSGVEIWTMALNSAAKTPRLKYSYKIYKNERYSNDSFRYTKK